MSPNADEKQLPVLSEAGLNWKVVLALADEHGVPAMLGRRLEKLPSVRVPESIREQLQAAMRRQSLVTLGLTAELFRVLEEFANLGISAIPVKGPLLSQIAYGDPALRSFGDIDLLVAHRDIARAIERMQAMGFAAEVPSAVLQSGKIPGEYLFRRGGSGAIVELHTERTFRHYPRPMRIEEMMGRKRRVLLDGRELPALSLEDELVFNCVHGGKDFWERLMWVSDVAAILINAPTTGWARVQQFAASVGAETMLLVGVQLAAGVFDLKLPAEISQSVAGQKGVARLCSEIQRWLVYAGHRRLSTARRALYRIKMAGGGSTGLKYLVRLSLSPTQDDWEEDAGNSWLRSALRRPFRLVRKYRAEQ